MINEPPSSGARANDVASLRAELTRLTERVDGLQTAVGAAADLADAIDELGTRVEQIAQRLTQGGGLDGELGPVPVAWVDVEPNRAATLLVELSGWISTVLAHHRVAGHLHPCWYRHPGLVQLLIDTRTAWLVAYRNPGSGRVLAALDWSQRHLPHMEDRVRELLSRCSSVRHEPATEAMPATSVADLRTYASWWASDRRPVSEPAPPARPSG